MIKTASRVASLVLSISALLLAGCRAEEESRVSEGAERPLVAVSNMLHPPFSSRDESGRVVGLEVDLIAAAARRLGREVVWEERPFGELLAAVASGEADFAASTIGITAERQVLVDFSDPYFETSIVALVRPGSAEPRSLGELRGLRVAAEQGTTAVGAARASIPAATRITERIDERSWAQLLADGEVDAVVIDASHTKKFISDAGVDFRVIEEPLAKERFGIAVRKHKHELKAALDSAILEHSRR